MTIPQGELSELLIALIRNACVNDGTRESGHEARSIATLAGFFGQAGQVFEPEPGRCSAVYRVPGRSSAAPTLMLMGHVDVVPADASGWSADPFGGERRDGFIWGRGAIDMLNQTAAMAAVFRRYLVGDEPPLAGDLVVQVSEIAGQRHEVRLRSALSLRLSCSRRCLWASRPHSNIRTCPTSARPCSFHCS